MRPKTQCKCPTCDGYGLRDDSYHGSRNFVPCSNCGQTGTITRDVTDPEWIQILSDRLNLFQHILEQKEII